MPVALDETVDEEVSTSNERLQRFATDGVIAMVPIFPLKTRAGYIRAQRYLI